MPRFLKPKRVWIPVLAFVVIAIVFSFFRSGDPKKDLVFSEVIGMARAGKVEKIVVRGTKLDVRLHNDATPYASEVGTETDVTQTLQQSGVVVGGDSPGAVAIEYRNPPPQYFDLLAWIVILAVLGAMVYFAARFAIRRVRRDG